MELSCFRHYVSWCRSRKSVTLSPPLRPLKASAQTLGKETYPDWNCRYAFGRGPPTLLLLHVQQTAISLIVPSRHLVSFCSFMQEWLQKQGRDDEESQAVVTGFKRALHQGNLTSISFSDFAKQFQWLVKTLKVGSVDPSWSHALPHVCLPVFYAECQRG